jgi:hypothetical protein
MFHKLKALSLGLIVVIFASAGSGQTPGPPASQPTAGAGIIKLTGDDARRADELDKAIDAALTVDRWDEAIAKAQDLLDLRTRVQGPKCFEAVDAQWRQKALRRVAPMPKEDRFAFRTATTVTEQAQALDEKGKYAQAQPLYEQALDIKRRLLSDDDPGTASGYNNLATNLYDHGKFAAAERLCEKALEIRRRLLTDDHPDTPPTRTLRGTTLRPATDGRLRPGASIPPGSDSPSLESSARRWPSSPCGAHWLRCWPGSVNHPTPGKRSRKTSAEGSWTSWPPGRTGGLHPRSGLACAS